MVGEVIYDEDAVVLAFNVQAAANGAEGRERLLERRRADAPALRDDDGGERVQNVVATLSGERELSEQLALAGDAELHVVARESRLAGNPVVFRRKAVGDDRAKRLGGRLAKRRARIFRVAPDDHAAIARNQIH